MLWETAKERYDFNVSVWYKDHAFNEPSDCPHPWKDFDQLHPYLQWYHMHFDSFFKLWDNPEVRYEISKFKLRFYDPPTPPIGPDFPRIYMYLFRFIPDVIWGNYPGSYPLYMHSDATKEATLIRDYPDRTLHRLIEQHTNMLLGKRHHSFQRMNPAPHAQYA